jgi:amino acid adenylation domain-containing protein
MLQRTPSRDETGHAWLDDQRYPLDWNGPTDQPFDAFADGDRARPIVHLLERTARRHPGRIAIIDDQATLSYGELWAGVSGLAEILSEQTRPGDLVGVMLPVSTLLPLAMFACFAAGRAFVPLDIHYPAEWIGQVLDASRPALVIAAPDDAASIATRAPSCRVLPLRRAPAEARADWRPAPMAPDAPACVLFTSGSTGRPKGVVNSQQNLLQRVAHAVNAGHIRGEDRFLTLASPCTIVGVRDILTAMLAGAAIRMLDAQTAGAREILGVIHDEAVTILFAFPALLRSVVEASRGPAGEALRLVRIGGDTTLWSDIDRLRTWLSPAALIQLIYAATEAPAMQWFVHDSRRGADPRLPIGYPVPGARLAVVDDDGRPTPPGEIGELIVGGPYVSLGLWVEDRCVAGAFAADPEAPGDRLFRSGDLVRLRPDGFLERIGRKDRQVKIRGVRVELDGVEAALRRSPWVRDVAAMARPGAADGQFSLIAYVSAHSGAPPTLIQDLRAMMEAEPAAMRPARLYQTDAIPRLPSSKLDMRALQALDAATLSEERAAAAARPADPGEDRIARAVARVWEKVLGAPAATPEADFFRSGGDSLRAITLISELELELGVQLPLTLINEAPTVVALGEALRTGRAAAYTPLAPLKAGEGYPPLFFVHGVGGNVTEIMPIARNLSYPGAVIGIQARGLAGPEPPHASVEAMAEAYVAAVKARQPHGPYQLCGYSFGGLVAFEMACRMNRSGDQVALVGLFDTLPDIRSWPAPALLGFLAARLIGRLRGLTGHPAGGARTFAGPAGRRLAGRLFAKGNPDASGESPVPGFLAAAPASVRKVGRVALAASSRYRPGSYPGEIRLFVPTRRDPALPAPAALWRRHARRVTVVPIVGDHASMISEANAAALSAHLLTA